MDVGSLKIAEGSLRANLPAFTLRHQDSPGCPWPMTWCSKSKWTRPAWRSKPAGYTGSILFEAAQSGVGCLASKCPFLNVASVLSRGTLFLHEAQTQHEKKHKNKVFSGFLEFRQFLEFSISLLSLYFLNFFEIPSIPWGVWGFCFYRRNSKAAKFKILNSRVSSRVPQETGFFVDAREVQKNHIT